MMFEIISKTTDNFLKLRLSLEELKIYIRKNSYKAKENIRVKEKKRLDRKRQTVKWQR